MNRLVAALGAVAVELEQNGYAWALVGGLAVSARATPRFTRDIDIAVAVESDTEAGECRAIAAKNGEEETEIVIDFLFASCGIEPELVASAERLEVFPNMTVPVPRTGHLIAMKLLSVGDHRRKDQDDLEALMEVADHDEIERARGAVTLIMKRGIPSRSQPGSRHSSASLLVATATERSVP